VSYFLGEGKEREEVKRGEKEKEGTKGQSPPNSHF